MSFLQRHSASLSRWPLLALATLLILLLAVSALLWTGTSPAGAQDGHQPDPQVVDDVWDYAREMQHGADHVLRWMRVLHTFGALDDMSAAEAQDHADQFWAARWDPVVTELTNLEAQDDYTPDPQVVDDVRGYAAETDNGFDHVLRWMRVLHTLGALDDMSAAEAQGYADQYTAARWDPVVAELTAIETAASAAEPDPTATPEPTPTPQPNQAPVVNTQAKYYSWFTENNNAPRGVLVSKPFRGIFSDPDGDNLSYSVAISGGDSHLVEMLLIPPDGQSDDLTAQSSYPIPNITRVWFRADGDADWKAITPTLPDRPVITVTLTATDPDGLSASVSGDFLIWWESYPEVVHARADGAAIALTFDWAVEANPAPAPEQFTVRVVNEDGSAGTVEVNSVSVNGKVVTLDLASAPDENQIVTLDYAYNYHDDTPLQRAGGGDAAPGFTGQAVTFLQPPGEPQNFAVSAEPSQLNLSAKWDAVEGATSYNLRLRRSGGEFNPANAFTFSDTSATITVPSYGQWEVRLQGCSEDGCGPEASRTVGLAPAVHLGLTPASTTEDNPRPRTITAAWDPVPGAASYTLRWWRAGEKPPSLTPAPSRARQQRSVAEGPSGTSGDGGQGTNSPGTNPLRLPAQQTSAEVTLPDDGTYLADLQALADNGDLVAKGFNDVHVSSDETDTTPPRLVRGEIDGSRMTLYFSEAIDEASFEGQTDLLDHSTGYFRLGLWNTETSSGEETCYVWKDYGVKGATEVNGNAVTIDLARQSAEEGLLAQVYYVLPINPRLRAPQDLAGNSLSTPLEYSSDQQATRKISLHNLTKAPRPLRMTARLQQLTLTFDKTLNSNFVPAAGAFKVDVNGSAVSLADVEPVIVAGDTVNLALASPVASTDDVRVSYAKPANNPLWGVGGAVASFSGESVTNATGAPAVSEVAITSVPANGEAYALGETIQVKATFTEAVEVTGAPRLKIKMDPDYGEKWADYTGGTGGSGTAELTFTYQVVDSDRSTRGVAVLRNMLELNGGGIRSVETSVAAYLAHVGLGHDRNHAVDGAAPSLQVVAVGRTTVSLTFSEVLDAYSVPPAGAFTVKKTPQGGDEETVDLSGTPVIVATTVILCLANPVLNTDGDVKVSYSKPASEADHKLKDRDGNEAVSFTDRTDTTPPRLLRGEIDSSTTTLYFSEELDEDSAWGQFHIYRVSRSGFGVSSFLQREVEISGNKVLLGLGKGRTYVKKALVLYTKYNDPTVATLRDLAGNQVQSTKHGRYLGMDILTD